MSAAHSLRNGCSKIQRPLKLFSLYFAKGLRPSWLPFSTQTAADHDTARVQEPALAPMCIVYFCVPVPDRGKSGTKSVPIWGQIRYQFSTQLVPNLSPIAHGTDFSPNQYQNSPKFSPFQVPNRYLILPLFCPRIYLRKPGTMFLLDFLKVRVQM